MNVGLPWVQFSICECEFLKFTSARTYFSLWYSCFLQKCVLPDRKSMKGSQKIWLKNPWSCTRIDFLSSILSESTLFFFLLFQLHVLHLSLMRKFFIFTLLGHEKIQKQWKALRNWNYLHIYWFWVQYPKIRLADWRIRLSSLFTKWYSWEIFDFMSSIVQENYGKFKIDFEKLSDIPAAGGFSGCRDTLKSYSFFSLKANTWSTIGLSDKFCFISSIGLFNDEEKNKKNWGSQGERAINRETLRRRDREGVR